MRSELARLSSGGGGAAKSQIAALERQATANGCRGTASWGRPRACAGIDAQIAQLKRQGGGVSNPARVRQLQRAIARNCAEPAPQRQRQARQSAPAPAQTRNDTFDPDRMTTHGSVIIHGTRPDNFLGSQAKQRTGFFETLFGNARRETRRDDPNVETVSIDPVEDARKAKQAAVGGGVEGVHGIYRGGGLKTWCVRLCDGFYFPVSYSTSSSNYQRDLAICQHRCPGADVSLYSHPGSLNPENMVSAVSGERYTKLPTAFAYRTKVTGNCSCELTPPDVKSAKALSVDEAADTDVAADGDAVASDQEEVAVAAVSPDAAGDQDTADGAVEATAGIAAKAPEGTLSETGANVPNTTGESVTAYADPATGGSGAASDQKLVMDTIARPSAEAVSGAKARPITEADLNVRKVGPTYYADQIAASANGAQVRPIAR